MKKMMMAVAGLAMAVVLTGCGGSPKGVAEKFVNAIIQKDGDKALSYVDLTGTLEHQFSKDNLKHAKDYIEDKLGKEVINDTDLTAKAVFVEVKVPAEDSGYMLRNGKKYTGETATVKVQFFKKKDKKDKGMTVELVKVDGKWKVVAGDFRVEQGFDTSDDK